MDVLTYPNILDSSSTSSKEQRLPTTGTSDQIGSDIARIKAMDVEHIIFGHAFSPVSKDMKKMIETPKVVFTKNTKKIAVGEYGHRYW